MLNFKQQYNISFPVFLTFNSNKEIQNVYHSEDVMNRYKQMYNFGKFETYTPSKFKMTCIYIMFTNNISSYTSLLEKLNQINFNDVYKFRDTLINHKKYINEDIEYLTTKYGKPNDKQVLQEYYQYKIKFYTCWWYLRYTNMLDKHLRSPIYKSLLTQIQNLFYFISFKPIALEKIKVLMLQSDILNEIN